MNQYVCGCVAGYTGTNCETSKLYDQLVNHFGFISLCYLSTISCISVVLQIIVLCEQTSMNVPATRVRTWALVLMV